MTINFGQIVVWLIVGALAGSLAGMVATRSTRGYGRWANLATGLVGALGTATAGICANGRVIGSP